MVRARGSRARSGARPRARPGGSARGASPGARQRDRGLRRRRAGVRGRPRGRRGDPVTLGERHRQPGVRDHRHRVGRRLHLVHEQPREPAHALRQRPGHRPDGRGHLRPRRRHRRGLDAHAGAAPPDRRGRAPRRPALGRRDPLRPRRERHPSRARGPRRRRRPGEDVAPLAHQRGDHTEAAQRPRLRRVGHGPAPGGAAPARGHPARPGDRCDPGDELVESRAGRARGLRPRERAPALRHRGPRLVPREERLRPGARGASPCHARRPLRRRTGSLRGLAGRAPAGTRRDPPDRLPSRRGQGPGAGPGARGPARYRPGCGSGPGAGAPGMGPGPGRRAGQHPRRLLRPPHEPLAPPSGPGLPGVGPLRLQPARRRLRLPRPAPGRDGSRPGPAGAHARPPPPGRVPPVPGGGRAALVARAERPRNANALLRRPALVALRGRALRADDGRHGSAGRGRALPLRPPARGRRPGVLRPAPGRGRAGHAPRALLEGARIEG